MKKNKDQHGPRYRVALYEVPPGLEKFTYELPCKSRIMGIEHQPIGIIIRILENIDEKEKEKRAFILSTDHNSIYLQYGKDIQFIGSFSILDTETFHIFEVINNE